MPAMVLIEELAAKLPKPTFFLLTLGEKSTGGFCLRDYSDPHATKPREVMRQQPPEWTLERVERLAKRLDDRNRFEKVLEHDIHDYAYWHSKTVELNKSIPQPDGNGPSLWKFIERHLAPILTTVIGGLILAVILAWLKIK